MRSISASLLRACQRVVQLFLKEQNGLGAEFLAFEYVYSR